METAKGEQERAKWRWDSLGTRKWLGMSQFSAPWTGRQGVLIRGLDKQKQCSRLLDCLDVQFEKAKQLGTPNNKKKKQSATMGTQRTVAQIVDSLFCDASQGVGRHPVSKGQLSCLTQQSLVYSYEHDVLLTGHSHMKTFGWGASYISRRFSDAELRSLAGEAVSVPIAGLLVSACYLNPYADWW